MKKLSVIYVCLFTEQMSQYQVDWANGGLGHPEMQERSFNYCSTRAGRHYACKTDSKPGCELRCKKQKYCLITDLQRFLQKTGPDKNSKSRKTWNFNGSQAQLIIQKEQTWTSLWDVSLEPQKVSLRSRKECSIFIQYSWKNKNQQQLIRT